jgi:hypothetical protein
VKLLRIGGALERLPAKQTRGESRKGAPGQS